MSVLGFLLFVFVGLPLLGSVVVFVLGTAGAVVQAVASWFTKEGN